jgi:high-affinity iron transporter
MVFWMQKSASGLRSTLETRVNQGQGRWQIFMISFLAVLREGVELALFLLAAGFAMENQQVLSGALLGLAAAIFAGLIWFRYSNRLALRKFFQITNIILLLFAAGLFALGIHELIELHVLPAIVDPLYDLSTLLPESSLPGTLLSALFGYRSAPALLEVGAFWGYLAVVLTILYRRNRPAEQTGE